MRLKKEQNTQDMLSYLGSKRGEAQDLLGLYLQAMADPDKIAEATLPQLSTAFGTIVDKFAMLGDQSDIEAPDDGLLEALSAAADISPPDDVEMLQDLVMAAVNEALRKGEANREETMNKMAPGMGGMGGLF